MSEPREFIEIDDKYGISLQDNCTTVYLTRHGTNWHEPSAQKPWISVFYELEKLRKENDELHREISDRLIVEKFVRAEHKAEVEKLRKEREELIACLGKVCRSVQVITKEPDFLTEARELLTKLKGEG